MNKFLLSLLIPALFFSVKLSAQAPNISYPGPLTFNLGESIVPVAVKNTGGAVPARLAPQFNRTQLSEYTMFLGFTRVPSGDLYAIGYDMIYRITPAGVVSLVAGTISRGYADGTGTAASFGDLSGIASDAAGNLYVTDNNYHDESNSRIRKITPAGVVTTYASGLTGPAAITVDSHGIIYFSAGARIMKLATDGTVSLLAGKNSNGNDNGTGANASFGYSLSSITTDKTGNVYVADFGNNLVRKITPAGLVTTLAGSGSYGSQDGTGVAASFSNPSFVRTDSKGNLVVADGNPTLRKISPEGVVITLLRNGTNGQVDFYNFPNQFVFDTNDDLISVGGSLLTKIMMTGYICGSVLPTGLTFNPDGSLSGTPISAWPSTSYNILATNSSGISSTNVSIEVVVPKKPPVITSFSPAIAPSHSEVTLVGNYFTGTTAVTIGGKPCTYFNVESPTQILAVVPDSATSGAITVVNPYGPAHIVGFKYLPPIALSSFSPTSGIPGTVITIRGANFTPSDQVAFGGSSAQSVTFVSSTTLQATVSPYSYGTGDVQVWANNGSASLPGFTFIAAPVISSATPHSAPAGTAVTINGKYFNNATSVKFGTVNARSFKVISPTQITAVIATGSANGITVTTPRGSANYYDFVFLRPPVITQATPMKGGANTNILIYGDNLDNAKVTIGGVAATVTYAGSFSIYAIIGSTGRSGDIKVTTPGGTTTLPGFVWVKAPVITSFKPQTAGVGDKITITGSNFGETDFVTFGGISSKFTVLSPTTIEAIVGDGASGQVAVRSEGGVGTLSGFNYTGPAITSFLPVHAVVGQAVTITGNNFTNATKVDFGGVPATSFTINSATQITAIVGNGKSGAVTVTTPLGKASLTGFDHPGPAISYFTPYFSGPLSASQISIYGSNFTGATAVSFGGVPAASFTVVAPSLITATPATSKSGTVTVTTPAGSDSMPGFVWDNMPPVITSFTPVSQKAYGTVIITGTNLLTVTEVKFGGVKASSFYPHSATTLYAYVGSGATGSITVSNGAGTATKSGFTYTSPTIQSIVPAMASAGKAVTINGTNLDSVKSVKFGYTDAASFTIVSPKKIIAIVGNGTSGEVSVSGPNGSGYISGFQFLPPPTIYSFSPAAGGLGSEISIYGYALSSTSLVKIGNAIATITSVKDNIVKVKVGAGSTGKISLRTDGGTAIIDGFTWYPAPTITSASPMSANSETLVTINGTNFTSATQVQFGGSYVGLNLVSPTKIIAYPSYVHSGDITVTNPGGTATLPGFTFLPAPIITSFTTTGEGPNSTVAITGDNFTDVTSVQFGGIDAKSFTVSSATSIVASPGAGATGSITVKTTGGTASIPGFLYSFPPSVLSFSPASGPIGTTLTIKGDNFNLTAAKNTVFIGPIEVQVKSATKTQLAVVVPAAATGLIVVVNTDKKQSASSNLPFSVTTKVGFTGYANKMQVKLSTQIYPAYAVDDLDGDGKPDILVANGDSLYMLKNTGSPALSRASFSQKVIIETGKSVQAMVVGDVDGDGKKDIVISIPNCIAVLHNTSVNGTLSFETKVMEYMTNATGLMLRDVNQDGRPDLITGTSGYLFSPACYPNTTVGSDISFGPIMGIYNPYSGGTLSFALTDIDGDNKPDLILGGSYSDITIFQNNVVPADLNLGEFPLADDIYLGYNYSPWSIATADFDGDGKADLVNNPENNQFFVFKNTATKGVINTSSFAAPKAYNSTSLLYNMRVADINGDGKIDVVGSSNTKMYYTHNLSAKGVISFDSPVSIIDNYLNDITFVDIDGDGRPDVLGIDQQNMLNIYNNSPKLIPQITSVTPLTASTGTKVTITGKYFDETSVVKFGTQAAKSFTIVSPQTIEAIVNVGATGNVTVQNPDGRGLFPGFTFIPAPVITSASASANGSTLVIIGKNFTNATDVIIAGVQAISFTVNSVTQITAVFPTVSGTLTVTTPGGTATLPAITFKGNSAALTAYDHDAGKLSVYTDVNRNSSTVKLSLSGGSTYLVELNGTSYNTSNNFITLPLNKGDNKLTVSTDKIAQGKVEQIINLSAIMVPYPNPFQNALYINIGSDVIKQGTIKIFNLSNGLLKLTKDFSNQSGVVSIDVAGLEMGIYTLHLVLDSKEYIYKIYK